jgi:protoporphyrin/coproporphyrin ferrochelatase
LAIEYADGMNELPSMPGSAKEPTDELADLLALPREAQSPAVVPSLAPVPAAAEQVSPPLVASEASEKTSGPELAPLGSPPADLPVPTVTSVEAAARLPSAAPLKVAASIPLAAPEAAEEPAAPALATARSGAKPGAAADGFAEALPTSSGIGVLLVNLGTPDAAEPRAVRRYLREFLTDPRVIEKDSWLWKVALHGIILPLRSRRKARDYKKIWNNEKDESPLKTITRSQAEKLAGILEPLGKHVVVDWAMRYANPSIVSGLEALLARHCDRILVMPLYPQYAAPTTATASDEVFRFLMGLRRQPALRIMPAYYDDPYYIEVLASSLKVELKALPFKPDVIVASYHGMPEDYVRKGDPYESQCMRTTELLREHLKLGEDKLIMTYQSRFGRGRWLKPYTIKTMKALAKKGVKNVVVMTPGFSVDCLETLEEIAVENARVFKRYGGENFAAIPCLNDSEAGMLMIWQLAMRELKGWV